MTAKHLFSIGLSVTFCLAVDPTILATHDHEKHDAQWGS
jgi:hypothetical protein